VFVGANEADIANEEFILKDEVVANDELKVFVA